MKVDESVRRNNAVAAGPPRLRSNAIGLVAAATLGIVFMSPALAFYGNWGPVASISGGASGIVFLIGALFVAPTAIAYAFVARKLPTAGSAYAWIGHLTNRHIGNWLGWMMLPYYILVVCTPSTLFGLFFNALLGDLGLKVGLTDYGTFALGVVIAFTVATFLAARGITTSTQAATLIVAFEVLIILALSTTILVQNVGHLTLTPFNPSAGTITYDAFWLAMPIAFFSFQGFDVISAAAEETKLPGRAIPRATIIAVILFTVYLVYAVYAFSFAVPLSKINDLISSGITPVTPIGKQYWGGLGILVSITGLTAGLGATLAIIVGTSRIMFAMARDQALPTPLARLTQRYLTPVSAMAVIVAVGILFDLIGGIVIGALNVYVWAGTATVFFALVVYLFVNIGSFLLYRRNRAEFNWWWHAIIPLAGVLFCAAILYKSFLQALWNAGWVTIGRSIVVFALAWTVIGFVYAYVIRNRAKLPRIDAAPGEVPVGAGTP